MKYQFGLPMVLTCLALTNLLLSGCSTQPVEEKDSAPARVMDWAAIPDAQPKWEPPARYGNHSPYQVFGKTYHVMESAKGYRETGIGSWYGKKFAGRPTSSQEPYDPYAMTAAHKSLPLPSYVRVTNLENQRSIIVRVNDRGPFHQGRIIDLSYAAAHKIGYADQGTAKVLVEVIHLPGNKPDNISNNISNNSAEETIFLQAGAFRSRSTAEALQQQLAALTDAQVVIHSPPNPHDDTLHRVHIGPFTSQQRAEEVQNVIRDTRIADPLLIRR